MSTSSHRSTGSWTALLVSAAVIWHLLAVVGPAWTGVQRAPGGRDFASYYYAAEAARRGEDPYDRRGLGAIASEDGTRGAVHPFFYPPPFVALTSWVTRFDLHTAFRIWFWGNEVAAVAAALALAGWWRRLDPVVPVAVAGAFALFTSLPNNHAMGQANLPVLALVIGGLWAERAGRWGVGGVLLGIACMAKMSPALFVAWWLLHRQWRPVAAACGTAMALSILSLPFVGAGTQLRFYTEVLPQFASGDYNGLAVPIGLFGNHSIPNALDWFLPGRGTLSVPARALASVSTLALLAAVGWTFRRPDPSPHVAASQVGAIAVAMLLVPVYTYEHHLVWAIPAVVAVCVEVARGRIPPLAAAPMGAAFAFLAFDLQDMKVFSEWVGTGTMAGVAMREAKFVSLVALLVAGLWLGHRDGGPSASNEEGHA